MDFNINNSNARTSIETCWSELEKIGHLLEGFGAMANPTSYLTRYSIIKACGTIEYSFKTIICDHQYSSHSLQVQNFINEKFRNSSMNPSFENILSGLKWFDPEWKASFKERFRLHENRSRLQDSLKSLNTARNTFAHGNNPTASFANIRDYFCDSVVILEIMESVIIDSEIQEANAQTEDETGIGNEDSEGLAQTLIMQQVEAEAIQWVTHQEELDASSQAGLEASGQN
ncbi:HEPN domain-containing protein [Rahnella aceris]